jgi:hypothetical protein
MLSLDFAKLGCVWNYSHLHIRNGSSFPPSVTSYIASIPCMNGHHPKDNRLPDFCRIQTDAFQTCDETFTANGMKHGGLPSFHDLGALLYCQYILRDSSKEDRMALNSYIDIRVVVFDYVMSTSFNLVD